MKDEKVVDDVGYDVSILLPPMGCTVVTVKSNRDDPLPRCIVEFVVDRLLIAEYINIEKLGSGERAEGEEEERGNSHGTGQSFGIPLVIHGRQLAIRVLSHFHSSSPL